MRGVKKPPVRTGDGRGARLNLAASFLQAPTHKPPSASCPLLIEQFRGLAKLPLLLGEDDREMIRVDIKDDYGLDRLRCFVVGRAKSTVWGMTPIFARSSSIPAALQSLAAAPSCPSGLKATSPEKAAGEERVEHAPGYRGVRSLLHAVLQAQESPRSIRRLGEGQGRVFSARCCTRRCLPSWKCLRLNLGKLASPK